MKKNDYKIYVRSFAPHYAQEQEWIPAKEMPEIAVGEETGILDESLEQNIDIEPCTHFDDSTTEGKGKNQTDADEEGEAIFNEYPVEYKPGDITAENQLQSENHELHKRTDEGIERVYEEPKGHARRN